MKEFNINKVLAVIKALSEGKEIKLECATFAMNEDGTIGEVDRKSVV